MSRAIFHFELKIHSKDLNSKMKQTENIIWDLKNQGGFNKVSVTKIRNVNLQCIKITNGRTDHFAYLKVEADYINLENGKMYTRIITHVIWKQKFFVKINNQVIVFCYFEPLSKINDEFQIEITKINA